MSSFSRKWSDADSSPPFGRGFSRHGAFHPMRKGFWERRFIGGFAGELAVPPSLPSISFRSPPANIVPGAPGAWPVMPFPGQSRAFRCFRRGSQQQSQSHRGNILRVSSLSDYGTPFVSIACKATRGATYPQFLRTKPELQRAWPNVAGGLALGITSGI